MKAQMRRRVSTVLAKGNDADRWGPDVGRRPQRSLLIHEAFLLLLQLLQQCLLSRRLCKQGSIFRNLPGDLGLLQLAAEAVDRRAQLLCLLLVPELRGLRG